MPLSMLSKNNVQFIYNMSNSMPLAARLRPTSIDTYVGQSHLVGSHGALTKFIENKMVPSMILYGNPGVGKTTLARIIAKETERTVFELAAISSGVKDVREVIQKARSKTLFNGNAPILFIDEIHRFSKSQQDSLLGAVEKGDITLIGATTENPSIEVIPALLSRCHVYKLKPLDDADLIHLLNNAINNDSFLKNRGINLQETTELLKYANGDARRLLNIFEWIVQQLETDSITVNDELVRTLAPNAPMSFDKKGDVHFDVISAFIKSIRGSDPNAAIYWLALMLESGQDPKFIARRMIISASEDIGNANPTALVIANNCYDAVAKIGMPEAEIILAQGVTYLATSAKSNAAYLAIKKAKSFIQQHRQAEVPIHLRNASNKTTRDEGYGKDYKYPHDFPSNFVRQEYFPKQIASTQFYFPGGNQREEQMRKLLHKLWSDKYNYE